MYRQQLRAEPENYRRFLWNSYSNPKKTFDATGKDLKKEKSLVIEQLMKPEKNYELIPDDLLLPKKNKKKKSRGLHM